MKLYIQFFICFTYFIPSEHTSNNESSPPILFNTGPGYKLYYQIDSTFDSPQMIFIRERFNNNNEIYAQDCIRPKFYTVYNTEIKKTSYKTGEPASIMYTQMMTAYNNYHQNQFPSQKSKKRRCN